MEEAVDHALHVQAIQQANGTKPKETRPAEKEVAETERNCDKRDLHLCPEGVSSAHYIGAPLFHARRFPLVKPSQMRPPKPAVARTRDIVHGVRIRVMISMVRDPCARGTRTVKNRAKNQKLFNYRIEFDCAMRKVPVKTDRRSKTA